MINYLERLEHYPRHPSIRGEFGYELYKAMVANPNVWLLTADLGFGLLNPHLEDFPERAISVGASEQSMMGIAVGLSLEKKRVFCYTISSFYARCLETIHLYASEEEIPIQMIGSGRDGDYHIDGPSHHGGFVQAAIGLLNIDTYYPNDKSEIPSIVKKLVKTQRPSFLSLRR